LEAREMDNKKEHILLKYAKTYKRHIESLAPEGCIYDPCVGAWVISKTGKLLIETTKRPKPPTKKCDIETGEDQKGE
jgi:hypothetical protein